MTIFFSKTIILLLLYLLSLWGEGGGLQKEYVLYTRENDQKNGQPLKSNGKSNMRLVFSMIGMPTPERAHNPLLLSFPRNRVATV